MLKTGRVSALHAGTNPVFNTVVAFSRFNPLLFDPLSTVRPSRPGKTLHHDQ
jgi:hypothetical protein